MLRMAPTPAPSAAQTPGVSLPAPRTGVLPRSDGGDATPSCGDQLETAPKSKWGFTQHQQVIVSGGAGLRRGYQDILGPGGQWVCGCSSPDWND